MNPVLQNSLLQKVFQLMPLTKPEIEVLFKQMLSGQMDDVVIAAVLISLKHQPIKSSYLQGAALALLDEAVLFNLPHIENCVDCCGTGGDGQGLLNISTAVSFIAAACGLKVVKHGNRAVSSKSGSADVLKFLGIPLIDDNALLIKQLDSIGLTFLFAPYFHPSLKHIMPVRKKLATRTLFNILGPIVNPAMPKFQLMGVYDKTLCKPVAEALLALGRSHALVVYGSGLDEIAIHGPTHYAEVKSGQITEGVFELEQLGAKSFPLDQLKGKDPQYNAIEIKALLKGKGNPAFVEAVAVNCGALLYCADKVSTVKEGIQIARETIASGKGEQIRAKMASLSDTQPVEITK